MDPFDLRLWSGFEKAGGNPSTPAMTDQMVIDSRRIDSPHALFVALSGEMHDGHEFVHHAARASAKYALVKKNWHPPFCSEQIVLLKVEDPLQAFQEIAHAYRLQKKCQVFGIVGSYGKTMVKDLLQEMTNTIFSTTASPESFNSQIGVPLSLLTIKEKHQIAFIEAGFSEKKEMDVLAKIIAPNGSILTHIGKKHLANLGDKETMAAEMIKMALYPNMTLWNLLPNDLLLIPFLSQLKTPYFFWNTKNDHLPHVFSLSSVSSSPMSYQVQFPNSKPFLGQVSDGYYYFLDLLNITVKAAWLLGVPPEAIKEVLHHFQPEPMRTEIWKSSSGVTFINDSYCSDPQSVDLALKRYEQTSSEGQRIFVFGGMRGKKQHPETDYRRVGKAINHAKVDRVFLAGNHPFTPLKEEIKSHSPSTEVVMCETYQQAFSHMYSYAKGGDVVLIKGEKKAPLDHLMETFNDSISNNQCLINLAAIQSNIETIRKRQPKGTRLMMMVKALAYGTDEVTIAKFLKTCGIDILGVSYVDEGIALKRAGVTQSIFVINAALYEAAKVIKWELDVGVSDEAMIQALALEAGKQGKSIKVHLHIDTGMGRFGCRPEEALSLARLIQSHPLLILEGAFTHFACADNPQEDLFTMEQARRFEQAIQSLHLHGISVRWKHAANSAAAIRFQLPQFNMIRIGLAAYGLYASESAKQALELRLALSLLSRIVGINVCCAGETISYGRSYTVEQFQERIAVLPIGYFDGLHRNYSGKGHVIIRGQKAPMVGKICMDFMMVDITSIPNAAVGDPVLIFGEDEYGNYLSPEELALRGDSIAHELITCLGPRIQRIFVHEEAQKLR
jgi:alanine racemase